MATSDVATGQLIARGKQQGYVTLEEIYALFPNTDNHLEEIDALCQKLADLNVMIVSAADVAEMARPPKPSHEPAQPTPLSVEDIESEDLYELYMADVRKFRLLKAQDEVRLGKLIEQGKRARARLAREQVSESEKVRLQDLVRQGDDARQQFITANLRLVGSVVWRFQDRGLPVLDLIQEGNIGLMKAVDGWDYRLGFKFSTYAIWWIRQSMSRAVADQGRIIRLPVHMQEQVGRVERAIEELASKLGRKPSVERIARHCGMSAKRAGYVLSKLQDAQSLDSLLCCPDFPLMWDSDQKCFARRHPCPVREFAKSKQFQVTQEDDFELPVCLAKAIDPRLRRTMDGTDYSMLTMSAPARAHDIVDREDLRIAIDQVLETISARQRDIIRQRYGLDGDQRTLEEIGIELGLTRERIRQIQHRAIGRLKHLAASYRLSQFWLEDGE